MHILTEIHRQAGINLQGKAIERTAVRAVVRRGRKLLMVYSTNIGDYKFPGGGVDVGETHTQTLYREVQEECGMRLTTVGEEIGAVIEYNFASDEGFDLFKMTSHYYHCDVQDGFGLQKLDSYEQDLGFKPVWIDIDEAIQANRLLLNTPEQPEWLRREIFVLEYLK